ncbi:MAG: MbeD/MobD family mobilization/exclusion protein, partial [Thermodesulfovibrionales bacterium]
MKDKEGSPSEQKAMISRYEEEKQALTQKLAKALKENASLYERLAELDITMNIKTTELKKGMEDLTAGRDDLLEENEGLLKDLSSKEQKIQEVLRAREINRLLLEETNGQLAIATQRIKDWESNYTDLGNRLEAIQREKAALEEQKDTREDE